jgi:hypothetical protein
MSNEIVQADRANELHQELIKLGLSATAHFFRLGEILKEIRDNDFWKVLGYESFIAYFSDPELGYAKSSVYSAIKVVEMWPEWKSVADVPVSKLIAIAPHINKENETELLALARGNSKSDLDHELVVRQMVKAGNAYQNLPKVYLCNVCARVKGVNFDGLCHCGWTKKQIEYVSTLIEKIDSGELGGGVDGGEEEDTDA